MLALCVTGFTGILPFAVLRAIKGDLLLAAVDSALVIGVLMIGMYVWSTRRVRIPGFILTMFYMLGMVTVVGAVTILLPAAANTLWSWSTSSVAWEYKTTPSLPGHMRSVSRRVLAAKKCTSRILPLCATARLRNR